MITYVNEAIMKKLAAIKRKRLTERLLKIRKKSPALSIEDIVDAVRNDRARDDREKGRVPDASVIL